jgi:hypothetical protein
MNIIDKLNLLSSKQCSDEELISTANGYVQGAEILFRLPSDRTLEVAKKLQSLLSFETTPVFHNKGQKKYYQLHIHPNR